MNDQELNQEWNEQARGVKMSNPQGLTIFKYPIPIMEEFKLNLPSGADVLRVATIEGIPWLWAKVDLRNDNEERRFVAVKTGGDVPLDRTPYQLRYVGFYTIYVQMELALYVFEVTQ